MPSRPVGDLRIDTLTARFCYWQGASEHRYLFSQIELDDIANFSECVLLIASEGDASPRVHWVGEISHISPLGIFKEFGTSLVGAEFYVHLLAGCFEERSRVITDLEHQADKSDFQLSA